jgi:hypothetical protein
MDIERRNELVNRVKALRCSLPADRSLPIVTLEEFFVGNDDYGSIGCNLEPMLGPQYFYEALKSIRLRPNVQDVLVEVVEIEEEVAAMWPFADRVYVLTDGTLDDVSNWAAPIQPDAVEDTSENSVRALQRGFKCYSLWWD